MWSLYFNDKRMGCVISSSGFTISMGILEWIKHIVRLIFDKDLNINGCPLAEKILTQLYTALLWCQNNCMY